MKLQKRERGTEPGNYVCEGSLRKIFGVTRKGALSVFWSPCFYLQNVDFMQWSLQWNHQTHQLSLKQ